MIILTTPKIKCVNPIRMSSIVNYGYREYCLAEVDDKQRLRLADQRISFWCELGPGYIDVNDWDYNERWDGGIVEGCDLILSLGKEQNIACAIYELAKNIGKDPFILWEKSV